MDSNFLEQFERVRGLMFAAGPSGFLGFWSAVKNKSQCVLQSEDKWEEKNIKTDYINGSLTFA